MSARMGAPCALVTGATRGIGQAVVHALVRAGRHVVACGRDPERLTALTAQYPGQVDAVRCDLAEPGAAARLVDDAIALTGQLEELVCAAGIVQYASLADLTEGAFRAQLEVNLMAPWLMAQRAGLHMRARGRGAIVLVGSTLGERPALDTAAYSVSKAALHHAARALSLELAPTVRVNAVAPGVVDTDMVRAVRGGDELAPALRAEAIEQKLRSLAALHPLGRLGTPEEVADAVRFLLDATWITGTALRVDGGLLAG